MPFSDRADFSLIADRSRLRLGAIEQWTTLDVSEESTEATTILGVRGEVVAEPDPEPKPVFTADRPFFFLIMKTDGPILFVAEVGEPDCWLNCVVEGGAHRPRLR